MLYSSNVTKWQPLDSRKTPWPKRRLPKPIRDRNAMGFFNPCCSGVENGVSMNTRGNDASKSEVAECDPYMDFHQQH
ncbi:hypothetical protein Y032_0190g1274 [Ancylostoma ceylanicum]|uniref:Uncharacterized protein n=1 Tax=Ancylostoma ceylanicum TaxID=53326 RepID=A0A016SR52_9BILA|nr:hypothetical protein Y032_0190g1274 [Ancylostoma ceylanicum]